MRGSFSKQDPHMPVACAANGLPRCSAFVGCRSLRSTHSREREPVRGNHRGSRVRPNVAGRPPGNTAPTTAHAERTIAIQCALSSGAPTWRCRRASSSPPRFDLSTPGHHPSSSRIQLQHRSFRERSSRGESRVLAWSLRELSVSGSSIELRYSHALARPATPSRAPCNRSMK